MNKRWGEVLENTHEIDYNINDEYAWGCADSETLSVTDIEEVLELFNNSDVSTNEIMSAFVSVKRELEHGEELNPQPPVMRHYKDYQNTKKIIKDHLLSENNGTSVGFDAKEKQEEVNEFGEPVLITQGKKAAPYQIQIHFLEKAQVYGVGTNYHEAREDLRAKINKSQESKK